MRDSNGQFTETYPALVLTSRDGLNWTQVPQRASGPVTAISHGAGRFVAVTTTGNVLNSESGDSWRTVSVDAISWYQAELLAIAYDGARFVATYSPNFSALNQLWTSVAEGHLVHSTDGTDWRVDPIIGDRAMVPTSGGGRLLVFQSGNTAFHERRAGEETWRMHELPWRVRWSGNITVAPVTGAYGHGTFLLAHGSRSLIQSEPLEPAAPQSEPAPSPAIAEGVGSTVTFEAMPRGSEPMGYQWRRDGADIPGATSPYLTRAHSDVSGAAFTCWVTNAVGGATVGPFRVVTAEAAQLDLPPHGLGVRVRGTPGARYRLEGSVDLQSWFKLRDLELTLEGEDTAATGAESLSPSDPSRFFRARRLP